MCVKRMTATIRQMPAIAVTSYSREYSAVDALSAGFDYFLAKPIEPNSLVEAIFATHCLRGGKERKICLQG
jgi:CheY-like chemotaxis protein